MSTIKSTGVDLTTGQQKTIEATDTLQVANIKSPDGVGAAAAGSITGTAGQSVTGTAGAITFTAGAGGSTSGAGGIFSGVGGAGAAGNAAGGLARGAQGQATRARHGVITFVSLLIKLCEDFL
jgi:hypothetical protein